jgi:oligoendopeptidase F
MTTTCAPPTSFVPTDLDASSWNTLQPLYQSLLERPLSCSGCLSRLLLDRSELDAAAREAEANLYIRMTCHTDDESARRAYLDFIEQVEPRLKKASFDLDRRIAASPFAGQLDPRRYGVMLRDIRADVAIFREENIPLQTEETRLAQQYEQVCGAMTVEFRGQEQTLPQMGRYLEETDRPTREQAWRLVAERRHRDREAIDGIFDQMVSLRDRMARNAGFPGYVDYMFQRKHRFDYTPAMCREFHRAAAEVCVPVMRRLNRQRAETLGLNPLRPWDLAVDPRGRAPLRPFEDTDQLVQGTSRLFHRMDNAATPANGAAPGSSGSPGSTSSPAAHRVPGASGVPGLGAMFDSMRDGACLDLESRKGKAPGGYQYQRDRSRRPFIFMNAAGMQRDLQTMIHEAGHAFHSILCNGEPLLHYRHAPTEFSEVASMGMELLAFPYLGEFYDEADAVRHRRQHLEDLVKVLPWVACIDAFQHWVYARPGHTRQERDAAWIELDDRFGAAVDWRGLENYRRSWWQRQLHPFCVPLYYIEYGIAQLGALQLWLQAQSTQRDALDRYRLALSLGGSRPLPELFEAAGLAFDFGTDTMKRLMDHVQREIDRLPA